MRTRECEGSRILSSIKIDCVSEVQKKCKRHIYGLWLDLLNGCEPSKVQQLTFVNAET